MVLELEANQTQVQRIIQSKAFRTSEVHRNLLQYLAEKSLSGGAEALKEYTVGLDVFAKPESYDPRQESVVRMHVGRLRQKLAEYYRSEGVDDPIVVNVPKGGFKVTFETRATRPEPVATAVPAVAGANPDQNKRVEVVLGALLAIAAACALIFGVALWRSKASTIVAAAAPTPGSASLQWLWGPILNTDRPLMVCLTSSQGAAGAGTASASFVLGQFLAHRKANVLLTGSDLLTMPEVLMDNVVFLGPPSGNRQIQALSAGAQFVLEPNGIRNLHPQPGEPAFIPDRNPGKGDGADAEESQALISHLPGLYGHGDILSLSGNQVSGMLAAVRALTDPTLARELIEKLKTQDGSVPRYYQVVLQVRSMDSMPIEISYRYHRDLTSQVGKAEAQK
jgi:hypothetical protein